MKVDSAARLQGSVQLRPGLQVRAKYAVERLTAIALLISLSPLLATVWALIKLDDGGPALYRQDRVGEGGRIFRIWKFRSMVVDADRLLGQGGRVAANRITRVGRWLRLTSIDELPQLFNIVAGDMTIIGPRPVLPEFAARFSAEQCRRFAMRPGVTGWAQIHGRNTLPWTRRLALDVEYVDQYSLARDLLIALRTVGVVLSREGIVLDRNPEQVDDLPPPPAAGAS